MDIQSLEALIAISTHGSFSAAAERLHLTQPAISKRIQNLEQQVGASLFDRDGRRIHLTDAGKLLLPAAQRILQEVDNAQRTMQNLNQQVSGTLTFATSHHIGLHRLPQLLSRFIESNPEVELDLHFQESEVAYQSILRREVEFAFVTLVSRPPRTIEQSVRWQDKLVYVAAQHHFLARKKRLQLNELCYTRAVLPHESSATYQLIQQQFAQRKLPLKTTLPVNYLETIRMMVSVGLGWSVLPESMLNDRLTALPVDTPPLHRQLGIIQLRERTLSNAAQAFLAGLPD
ncbi:MAG: LysR family transcriptional regulator [Natronospirillum sp.]|uniref:LysR family transcriptional regulator n=1 Tax=Natronospirillum sp. TaxID=2812955 RepID=UPI0025F0F35D|nr:LysR family transcriptional regulator [Natronospirillum sp.]MCH8551376.1 LysR family transcriptional regulator [Natronospirillum sp.]